MIFLKTFLIFLGCIFSTSLFSITTLHASTDSFFSPGKTSMENVFHTRVGNADFFFFMSPEKEALARDFLVKSINHNNILFTTGTVNSKNPMRQIVPVATKYSSGLRLIRDDRCLAQDSQGRPIYPDPIGHQILDSYNLQSKALVEKQLGLKIELMSRDISIGVNQDVTCLHQEQFLHQREFFQTVTQPGEHCLLFQGLDLIDWQAAPGTFSACLVQATGTEDRLLMMLLPGETLGMAYTTPIFQNEDKNPPSSDHSAPPFIAVITPIDYFGSLTAGSWKGKVIHTTINGLVRETDVQKVRENAIFLPANLPIEEDYGPGLKGLTYTTGIAFKQLPCQLPNLSIHRFHRHPDRENVTLLESSPDDYSPIIPILRDIFNIQGHLSQTFHLTKKDGGFSRLGQLFSDISPEAEIIIINRSQVPAGYKHYPIAQDFTQEHYPWIQLYHFPPDFVMKTSGQGLKKLSLTPAEEILFRSERIEEASYTDGKLLEKLFLCLDILIFL